MSDAPQDFNLDYLVEQIRQQTTTFKCKRPKRKDPPKAHGKFSAETLRLQSLNQKRYENNLPMIMPRADRPKGPAAWGYARVSHRDQLEGESREAQSTRIKNYYVSQVEPQGLAWGGTYVEKESVSAYRKNFSDRPGGRQLLAVMMPGDHLIIDKVDRIWRNNRDFSSILEMFRKQNITLHFVNMSGVSCSMNTPMGDFLLQLFVSLGQLESARLGERNKLTIVHGRDTGNLAESKPKVGTKFIKNNGRRICVWDEYKRSLMRKVVELKQSGLSWLDTTNALEKMILSEAGASSEAIEAHMANRDRKRAVTQNTIRKWFSTEWQYQYYGLEDAMDVYKVNIKFSLKSYPVDPFEPGSQFKGKIEE